MDGADGERPSRTRRWLLRNGLAGASALLAGCEFGGNGDPATAPRDGSPDAAPRDGAPGTGTGGTTTTPASGPAATSPPGTTDPTATTDAPTADPAGTDAGTGTPRPVSDARLRVADPLRSAPSDRHFNPFNPRESACVHPGLAVFDAPVVYSASSHEAFPLVTTDWRLADETTLEVTFDGAWTWHDGDPVVARDYATQQRIDLEIRRFHAGDDERAHPAIAGVEAVDDRFARVSLHEPLAERFALQWVFAPPGEGPARGIYVRHDDPQWREWHDELVTRSGDRKESVVREVTAARYPRIDAGTAVGNGPFAVDSVTDGRVVLRRYDDHPRAEATNFAGIALVESDRPGTEQYLAGDVNAALDGFPLSAADRDGRALPDGHRLVGGGRTTNALLSFNCGHGVGDFDTPFADRRVRQAVCHLFDRAALGRRLADPARLFRWAPCRVPGPVLATGTHDVARFVRENCVRYGGNDTERAAELLRAAGYERVDGRWYTPDGERFVVEITNGSDREDFGVLARNLRAFGIGVEWLQVSTFHQRRRAGRYHTLPDESTASGVTQMWTLALVVEWLQSVLHFDTETTIPVPLGDPEGSSGRKEIDVAEHVRRWFRTGDSRYHRELVWWWNRAVPQLETSYRPRMGALDATRWDLSLPDAVATGVRYPLYRALGGGVGGLRYGPE